MHTQPSKVGGQGSDCISGVCEASLVSLARKHLANKRRCLFIANCRRRSKIQISGFKRSCCSSSNNRTIKREINRPLVWQLKDSREEMQKYGSSVCSVSGDASVCVCTFRAFPLWSRRSRWLLFLLFIVFYFIWSQFNSHIYFSVQRSVGRGG